VRAYVLAVVAAGLGLTAYTLITAPHIDLLPLLVACAAAAIAERIKVAVTEDSPVAISLSLAVVLAVGVALGPFGAALAGLAAGLGSGLIRSQRPPMIKTAFNAGLFALAGGAAALTYGAAGGRLGAGRAVSITDVAACAAAMLEYFLVAWPLLVGILRLTSGKPIREIWEDMRWMPAQIGVSGLIGFTLGAAYLLYGWVGAAVYVAPLLALREAMRQYTRRVGQQMDELRQAHAAADEANVRLTAANADLDSTNEGLLKTLAAVIDARDIYLYGHSVQASKYAGQVARKLGLSDQQVRVIELGALLHDLGKIGVSEAILNKPARLTDEEYAEVQNHCDIGYHLLSNLPHFGEVAEVVWSHHEEYDGTGYPRELKGEEIPIGARIVSVVEATEAMVSDRPYRKGMSPDDVLLELANGAGSQWDPAVVAAFSGILSADRKHLVMRNSALDVELSRTPVAELVRRSTVGAEVGAQSALGDVNQTFHSAAHPIFVVDDSLRVVAANTTAERATGWREAELQGRSWFDMCADPAPQMATPQSFFRTPHTIRMRRSDKTEVAVELVSARLQTNSAGYWLVLAAPADTATGAGDLAVQSDVLTGLANRTELERRVRIAMRKRVWPLTLVVFDIDGLGPINQTFGHKTGDVALTTMATVLASQLRAGDIAARVGDDRFAALMCEATIQDAGSVVARVEGTMPSAAAGLDCVVEFCSGAAEWNGEEDYGQLLGRAETWLAAEKRSRRGLDARLPVASGA
jgi:diguanylate cyclase (GGDEF)-like protein/PAS domain S-box-containing protein